MVEVVHIQSMITTTNGMHKVLLRPSKKAKQILSEIGVNATFCANVLTLVLNIHRPRNRALNHSIKLDFTDESFSMFTFERTLHISKSIIKDTSKTKVWYNFFNNLLHEFAHYVQFHIDRIHFQEFAVDHEEISHTKYMNNLTERQARVFGGLADGVVKLYSRIQRVMSNTKPLNSQHATSKETKNRKAKESHKRATSRRSKGNFKKISIKIQSSDHRSGRKCK